MLTAKPPARWRNPSIRARRFTETQTNGGSSDTDITAFAVIPCASPPTSTVTTVTGREHPHDAAELGGIDRGSGRGGPGAVARAPPEGRPGLPRPLQDLAQDRTSGV